MNAWVWWPRFTTYLRIFLTFFLYWILQDFIPRLTHTSMNVFNMSFQVLNYYSLLGFWYQFIVNSLKENLNKFHSSCHVLPCALRKCFTNYEVVVVIYGPTKGITSDACIGIWNILNISSSKISSLISQFWWYQPLVLSCVVFPFTIMYLLLSAP